MNDKFLSVNTGYGMHVESLKTFHAPIINIHWGIPV